MQRRACYSGVIENVSCDLVLLVHMQLCLSGGEWLRRLGDLVRSVCVSVGGFRGGGSAGIRTFVVGAGGH